MAADRPRAVRNLMAEFDAALLEPAVPVDTVPVHPAAPVNGVPVEAAPGAGVPAEVAVDHERVLTERNAAAERQRFAERWGYDILLDKPIDGGNWEYERIHPPPRPSQQEDPVQEAAVQEVPREP